MPEMKFMEAIRETIRQEMAADPYLFLIGEDVGKYGGEQGVTGDLWYQFGDDRIRDAPIAEASIIGCALGAAMTGCRAIAEIPFGDFLGMCMDQIYNQVAKMRYMSGGQARVRLVIRTTMGGYTGGAAQHSQCLPSWFVHVPGIKVVVPSMPDDAAGLLRASLRDGNPVIFFEHSRLYSLRGEVPDDPNFTVPLGKARLVREGRDCTVVATAFQVHKSLEAAKRLAAEGIEIEIVDPRTLDPLDEETILESVEKTGHAVVVHETWVTGGYGGEIAAIIADKGIHYLDGPVKRVGAKHTPIPFSPPLENYILPQVEDIVQAVRATLG
ncbi:MAG: alpha-ketoacid dehydrogenase subunit beta [Anaerolineae bacterium]